LSGLGDGRKAGRKKEEVKSKKEEVVSQFKFSYFLIAHSGGYFMYMHKFSRIAPFLVGLVLGVLAAVFLPAYARPYIPEWIMGKTIVVKGTVVAKQKKENVLLVTVNTPEGMLLATFKKKADEINLLINEKDSIEFTLPKYMPFIDDPKVVRVVMGQQAAPEPALPVKPKEQSAKGVKPKRQVKPPVAAPAPGAAEMKPPGQK
jgi:hypothetical protein